MPRGPRLDAPGTLHHVIVRGIERRRIVDDDDDRSRFVSRMGDLAVDTETDVYAWALMSNHAHILLRSGPAGLPTFMQRLLCGHAVYYNRRHHRYGHLFQNRYKSIVCEEDAYFKELVRYIHLNPLRAKQVDSLEKLDGYRWCGHAAILRRGRHRWQNRDYVLKWFGPKAGQALKSYREFIEKGIGLGRKPELVGGGLIRSVGGWSAVKAMRRFGARQRSDERILGGGDFVTELIEKAERNVKHQLPSFDLDRRIRDEIGSVCQKADIDPEVLRSGSRRRPLPDVRARLAMKLVKEHGVSLAETARQLGVTTSAIAQILRRKKKV